MGNVAETFSPYTLRPVPKESHYLVFFWKFSVSQIKPDIANELDSLYIDAAFAVTMPIRLHREKPTLEFARDCARANFPFSAVL